MSGNTNDPHDTASKPDAEPKADTTSDDSATGLDTTDDNGAPLDNPSGG